MHHPFVLLVGTRGFPLLLSSMSSGSSPSAIDELLMIAFVALLCCAQVTMVLRFICIGCDQCGKVEICKYWYQYCTFRTYDVRAAACRFACSSKTIIILRGTALSTHKTE